MNNNKMLVSGLLERAGITINGPQQWDIQVHDDRFYDMVAKNPSLGMGESYTEQLWDCQNVDECMTRILRADVEKTVKGDTSLLLRAVLSKISNAQSKHRAFKNGQHHYDIGNDVYRAMLDPRMVYTCAYWENASSLAEAQEHKLHLVCQKLGLQPGMRVLDIGCGWGSFAKFAAEHYGVHVTGITVSKEQAWLARVLCKGYSVMIELMDYRDLKGSFDRIVSLGMFEHVGPKNYRTYMEVAARCLKDDGLFLLHTIGGNVSVTHNDPWIDKYIFPGGIIPSIVQIGTAIENIFVMEDWHPFGPDYDRTLMAWHENFLAAWPMLEDTNIRYDQRFYRMWTYYLLVCAAAFRARTVGLWQILLSKNGIPGGCPAIR